MGENGDYSIILLETSDESILNVEMRQGKKHRSIGKLLLSQNIFVTERNENSILKKTNSFGLNYELIKNKEIPFEWVGIQYQNTKTKILQRYKVKREILLQNGKVKCFEGFEPKIFLPIKEFLKLGKNNSAKNDQIGLF